MNIHLAYLYLLSPLHTGGTSQEGNVVGIAREVHTEFPYLPSSSIRGRLRAATPESIRNDLWGNTIEDLTRGEAANGNATESQSQQPTDLKPTNLIQGKLWVGDASILWFPVPSLSHGVVWVSSPLLLRRWLRFHQSASEIPKEALQPGSFSELESGDLFLRDAVFPKAALQEFSVDWKCLIPSGHPEVDTIDRVFILSDRDCNILIQSSLWRQVKVKLNDTKTVEGGFRYEEAIPPETAMYFPWGTTTATNGKSQNAESNLSNMLQGSNVWQFGGQESLGRGLVELWNTQGGERNA